ncbi:isoaspartyl peptidase [Oscillospiraceae bacterium 50-60]
MERVQYIAARRARFNAICGPVNIPYGTTVEAVDGFLERDGLRLCAATSESAHKYFARDSDGHGLERGKLTAAIIATVSKRDKGHGARWAKLWADPMACRYRRADHADFWVWSHDFFEAPVEDLRHIAGLIGVGTKGERRR